MKTNERMNVSGVGRRWARGRFALLSAPISVTLMLMAGCGGKIDGGGESPTDPGVDWTDGMNFATEEEALTWVDRRANELGLDVRSTERDSEGKLIRLAGVTIGAPRDVEEKHAQLLREMGGSERTVRIGGKAFSLAPEAESDLATTTQALCSGSLCTTHESWKSNYVFYRSMGSNTHVTSGGYEFQRRTITGQGYMECIDYPGPLPVTCTGYCNYSQNCPAGMTQESAVGYPTCRRTCSGNVPNVTLSITAQAYETTGPNPLPSFAGSNTTHDLSLEVKFWEVVTPGLNTAISRAVGLCGSHTTWGPGGAIVSGNSHWGTVPSSCL